MNEHLVSQRVLSNFDQSFNFMAPRSQAQNQAQREETRHSILMTALKAFAEKGYAATSISYIAKEAGISKGLTYHYFKSKEDLLHGIFFFLNTFSNSAIESIKGKEPLEQLRETIEMTFQYVETNPGLVRFMTSLALQPEAMENLKEDIQLLKQEKLSVFVELFKDLEYPSPEAEAYLLAAMLDGASIGQLALKETYPLEAVKQKILNHYKL